jgi:hypothetical protein
MHARRLPMGRPGLLRDFDTMRRDLDSRGELAGMDRITARAFEMLTSARTRTALDIDQEPEQVRDLYGIRGPNAGRAACWLQARRLVEAGVPVVNFRAAGQEDWDTHTGNFTHLRNSLLPTLDQGLSALVSDLHARGLDRAGPDQCLTMSRRSGNSPNSPSRLARLSPPAPHARLPGAVQLGHSEPERVWKPPRHGSQPFCHRSRPGEALGALQGPSGGKSQR